MTVAADTATWIGAIAAAIGIPAAIVTVVAAIKSFRPKFRARIDARRQAIRFDVENKGRASGRIRTVVPIDPQLIEISAVYSGLEGRDLAQSEIPGGTSWHLIIEAAPRESGVFPDDTLLLVEYGRNKERQLQPEPADVGYWGEPSSWPK